MKQKVIEWLLAQNASELAKKLGTTDRAIGYWRRGERQPAGKLAVRLSVESGFALRDICPDWYEGGSDEQI